MQRRIALLALAALASMMGLASPAQGAQLTEVGAYSSPVFVTSDPANPDRLFVIERAGQIRLTTRAGTSLFTDLDAVVRSSGGEQGLLSMAFAPDYAASGLIYVYYTGNDAGSIHIAELTAAGDSADPRTLRNGLTIPHPMEENHNGGQLQFGPDGYLYAGIGDGGGSNDPFETGQNLEDLRGKLLRIDPGATGGAQYAIPPDNPFVGMPGADEVWSYGLRNPYRFSFDRYTGALTIGDVGQNAWEEVDFAVQPAPGRGVDYGWDCREGRHDLELAGCIPGISTDPVLEYSHQAGGCSITGGYVVHDPGLPELEGRYVYADFCRGQIRSALLAPGGATGDRAEGLPVPSPSSFGQDSCGRIYVASLSGPVFRLEDSTPTDCTTVGGAPPADASSKRCSEDLRGTRRADDLVGGEGGQTIRGRGGADTITGGQGEDCLIGGTGGDRVSGGRGDDLLRGGAGRDLLRSGGDPARDLVLCGAGRDRARVDPRDRVRGCESVRVDRKPG